MLPTWELRLDNRKLMGWMPLDAVWDAGSSLSLSSDVVISYQCGFLRLPVMASYVRRRTETIWNCWGPHIWIWLPCRTRASEGGHRHSLNGEDKACRSKRFTSPGLKTSLLHVWLEPRSRGLWACDKRGIWSRTLYFDKTPSTSGSSDHENPPTMNCHIPKTQDTLL